MSWPAVAMRGLSRRFGSVLAVDELDLEVEGPGVFGLLGANGAGKTTTLRMLVGLLEPTRGEVRLLGASVRSPAVRCRVGYLPQAPGLYPWMTAEEHMLHVGDCFGLRRAAARERAGALLSRCGLDDRDRRRRIAGYSGGMRQRLGLALALMGEPAVLMLDEPVSALDPIGRAEVLELLRELGRTAAVFMSSHILADVERVCPRVAILAHGRLIAHESTAALKARAARPGLEALLRGDAAAVAAAAARVDAIAGARAEVVANRDDDPPGTMRLRVTCERSELAEQAVPAALVCGELGLVALAPREASLEDVFIDLVRAAESARGTA